MAKVSVKVGAPIEKVWDALTRPELIKKWLYGTDTVTDWKPGKPILWRGTWEGKTYEDKGKILAVEKPTKLSYTYWSNFSGKPDIPENYATVVCELHADKNTTTLTVTQNCSEQERQVCETGWKKVLDVFVDLFNEV